MQNDANIFTAAFRNKLPQRVKDFLVEHKIDLVFKHEATTKLADNASNRVKTYVNLTENLKPLCNPPITAAQIAAGNANDVCSTHAKRYHNNLNWGERYVKTDKTTNISTLGTIGEEYLSDNIGDSLSLTHTEFDLIVLVSTLPPDPTKTKLNENPVGFLVSQLGECKDIENKFSSIPALNLICAPKKHKCHTPSCGTGCGVIGRILMFMYLYALKTKNIRYGILELAGLYCNVGGLCLYNKFGFREDITMKSRVTKLKEFDPYMCFPDASNLSMVCDLNLITGEQLVDALIDNKNVNLPDSEPLCNKPALSVEEANIEIDRRYENYNNILKFQRDMKVSTDDIKDDFQAGVVPDEKKEAVNVLAKLSREGKLMFKTFTKKPKKRKILKISARAKTKTKAKTRHVSLSKTMTQIPVEGSVEDKSGRRRSMRRKLQRVVGGWNFRNNTALKVKPHTHRKKYRY